MIRFLALALSMLCLFLSLPNCSYLERGTKERGQLNISRRDGQEYHLYRLHGSDRLIVYCGFSADGPEEIKNLLPLFQRAAYSTLVLRSEEPDIQRFLAHARLLPFRTRLLILGPFCQKADWSGLDRTGTVFLSPEPTFTLPAEEPILLLQPDRQYRRSQPSLQVYLDAGLRPGAGHLPNAPSVPPIPLQLEREKELEQFLLHRRIQTWFSARESFQCCNYRVALARQGKCLDLVGWTSSARADQEFCPFALRQGQIYYANQPDAVEGCRYKSASGQILYCKP